MTGFDQQKLEKLRRLSRTLLPGDLLAIFGILIAFFAVAIAVVGSIVASPQASSGHGAGLFYGLLWFLAAGGALAVIVGRIVLNAKYIRQNRIRLSYSFTGEAKLRYERLLKAFDELDGVELFRIAPLGGGDYERVSPVVFRAALPRFLDTNCDVYCLVAGRERCYLLPDCVLLQAGRKFNGVAWKQVLLSTGKIAGRLSVIKQTTVLVHGRIRKDGGYDLRYNTRTRQQSYQGWDDISGHGVLSFSFGKEKVTILTARKDLVSHVESAFLDWWTYGREWYQWMH
jgi:hypothetical protein